jgi:WD40 repeat protein
MATVPTPVISLATNLTDYLFGGLRNCGQIEIWSTVTNTRLKRMLGHTDRRCECSSRWEGWDGAASDDHTVQIWSRASWTQLNTLEGHRSAVACLAVGADGTLYSGSADETIKVWAGHHDGSHLMRTLEGYTGCVWSLALRQGGKLNSGSVDKTIRVWSAVDRSMPYDPRGSHEFSCCPGGLS